jgi:hypothetical protein
MIDLLRAFFESASIVAAHPQQDVCKRAMGISVGLRVVLN